MRERVGSEIIKRGYSDEEIDSIYELARFCLETGDIRRAEAICTGLLEVAPEYVPAWLGLAYCHIFNRSYDAALQAAQQAWKIDGQSAEAQLFLIACLMTTGDFTTAGTYLGEVGEKIEGGAVSDPSAVRFYRMQLARFQNR